jgi:drug/metabolite transporter (DMT)-like permease
MVKELYTLGASPYEITFLKGFFTVLLIGGYFLGTGKMKQNLIKIEKSYLLPLFVFSIIFVYGNSAYAEALQHTKVMNILILMYLSIFLGLIAGWFFFGEKIKKNILLYAILAFIGIIFTLYSEKFSFQFGIGEILALTIAVTLTATMVIVKYTPKINTWFRLFIVYGIGTLILFFIIGIE